MIKNKIKKFLIDEGIEIPIRKFLIDEGGEILIPSFYLIRRKKKTDDQMAAS